jgi:RecA-family ATPase
MTKKLLMPFAEFTGSLGQPAEDFKDYQPKYQDHYPDLSAEQVEVLQAAAKEIGNPDDPEHKRMAESLLAKAEQAAEIEAINRSVVDNVIDLQTRQTVPSSKPATTIIASVYEFPEESTIERYDWLYGRHLLRREVSGTAAKSGTGKSTQSIAEALAMTSGKQLLHDQVNRRPLRVVLISLEDSRSTMDKRIAAAMRHYKLTKEDIGGRLIVIAKGELKIKIAVQRKGSVVRNEKVIQSLIDLMLEHKADVLSIDSFRKTHGVQENDNVAIGEVIECYEDVADGANCGIHLWHHTRKTGGADASIEDARGAQAFIDSCRSVRILATMTKQEGLDLKIENYEFYFRSFNGKRNFAPPAEESYWYRLENIKLRNHTSDFEDDGDNVGVVTRWIYPQVRMPKITDNEIRRAQDAIRAGGPWRASQLSEKEPWVGIPIAEALGVNLLDARVRRIVAKLVKDWLKAGVLKVVVKPDRHREPREYVEVAAP